METSHTVIWIILLTTVFLAIFPGAHSQSDYASCYIFGTQHVFTFDEERIDFNSDLEITASETCPPSVFVEASFTISVSNEYKYLNLDSASQAKCVKIIYRDYMTQICSDQTASVNGDDVLDTILTSNGELMVYYGTSGREVAIQVDSFDASSSVPIIIRVSITPQSIVTVTVPSSYATKLCGLCGNFDGDSTNDLTLKDGTSVADVDIYQRGALIAQSYLVIAGGVVSEFIPSSCSLDVVEQNNISQPNLCGIYEGSGVGTFDDCRTNQLGLTQMFLDLCIYDYCENYLTTGPGDETGSTCFPDATCVRNDTLAKEAVNSITAVYVDICKNKNSVISGNWRTDYEAVLICSSGDYTSDGPYCPNVCGLEQDRCTDTGIDGCSCGANEWKEGDVCVPWTNCGCSDSNTGDYFKTGDSWIDNLCTTNYTCTGTNTISTETLQCSENSVCTMTGCVCSEGYVGDGFTCDRTCDAGDQAEADQCQRCPVGTYKESAGIEACTPCPTGQITYETGSTSFSDCKNITLIQDASNSMLHRQVADESFLTVVPTDVLPNGLPFGVELFRNVWVSTNGIVSFGDAFVGRAPANPEHVTAPLLAPFWIRQDLRLFGSLDFVRSAQMEILQLTKEVEISVSSFNQLDPDEDLQTEASNTLNQIKILLSGSESFRQKTVSEPFEPNYAIVTTWKNTVPNPAFLYSQIESLYYQCIVVTDGLKTYAVYIYPAGGIRLRAQYNLRFIYMGYNAQDSGVHRFNYYKSATIGIADIDTDPSNTDVEGRWVFEVANQGPYNPYAISCRIWYIVQRFFLFPFGRAQFMGPACPCNRQSAEFDNRYFYDYSEECAYSLTRTWDIFSPFPFFQKCCYDRSGGSLITDPSRAGFPVLYHPLLFYAAYEVTDLTPYLHCCRASTQCSLFRDYRPVDNCDNYRAPRVAGGFGDPHIYTLDQQLYTYNPVGEFWMIKSEMFSMQARMVQALDTANFAVPATQFGAFAMQSLPTNTTNSSSIVNVEINNNRTDYEVRVDGNSISNRFGSDVQDELIAYDGVMVKKFNNSITVSFEAGFSFRFSLRLNVLSIQSFIPDTASGLVDGLVGHFDGDPTNDLTNRAGDVVCVIGNDNCTIRTIHEQFGETWRITQQESIFWYRTGWNTETYTDLDFEPIFEVPENETTLELCNNDFECMFDVFMTNDTMLGEDTLRTRSEVEDKADVLGTVAPSVLGPTQINATVNELTSVIYRANYSGDYNAIVDALSIPPGATFEQDVNSDDWIFSWTPTNLTAYQIRFSANETDRIDGTPAVSPIFEVTVRLSDECANGVSDFDTLASGGLLSATFSIVQCVCEPGWTGSTCDVDYNGCVDNPCLIGNCTDVPAATFSPGDDTYECEIVECPPGYERLIFNGTEERDCSDVDECSTSNSTEGFQANTTTCINANCINTVGSFVCTCKTGYLMRNDSITECENIDECERGLDNCIHQCNDTDGSFFCSCLDGYELDSNDYSCTPTPTTEAICAAINCTFTCTINGTCICPRGQMLNADGRTCDMINECNNGVAVCDTDSGALCTDLDIGYECTCPTLGFNRLVNNYDPCVECIIGQYGELCNETCSCGDRARVCNATNGCVDCNTGWEGDQCAFDIDECINDICGPIANCTNTPGSYVCRCPEGYINKNFTHCENVDECTTYDPCSKLARCEDSEGSYTCTCEAGFTGDGLVCYDINECSPTDGSDPPCVTVSTCNNELGAYSCFCPTGYSGNGKVNGTGCQNDNECQEASNVCGGYNNRCVDNEGSYSCECLEGYIGDGVFCANINECTDQTYNCSIYDIENGIGACIDTNGSYTCESRCNAGYNLTSANSGDYICVTINECELAIPPCDLYTETCNDTEGSFLCICVDGYARLDTNSSCENIDECTEGTFTCTAPADGQSRCIDIPGSYTCAPSCNSGYQPSSGSGSSLTCSDIDECLVSDSYCNSATENCTNSIGSYECTCKEGYENVSNSCSDINECLNGAICGTGEGLICTNLEPFYECSCKYGYEGEGCANPISTAEFLPVEQVFALLFDTDWAIANSDARSVFNSLMSAALAPMYNATVEFLGVNILDVSEYTNSTATGRRKRATAGPNTVVTYDAVFSGPIDVADVIHQALDHLIAKNYMLSFNGTSITDQLLLAYPGLFDNGEVTCDTTITVNGVTNKLINCQGQGSCEHAVATDYPMCVCDSQYEGYNCATLMDTAAEDTGNLLALWVSVAVAGALLLGGLLACTMVMVYQRRQRTPKLHRYPRAFNARGPALFNPTGRMPTEAFNYQFPVGSVRDDLSDSSSVITTTTNRTQRTEGRIGSTVPFAPRWPRAYYAQLGDPDDDN